MITKKTYEALLNSHESGFGTYIRSRFPVLFELLFMDFWLLRWTKQQMRDPVFYEAVLKDDPRPIRARFDSTCASCKNTMVKGRWCYYWPASRKVYCLHCGEAEYRLHYS